MDVSNLEKLIEESKTLSKLNVYDTKDINELQIGDWVVITESKDNWGNKMNKFIGKIVKITNKISDDTYDNYNDFKIEFNDCEDWCWCSRNNHFRVAELHEIPKEL